MNMRNLLLFAMMVMLLPAIPAHAQERPVIPEQLPQVDLEQLRAEEQQRLDEEMQQLPHHGTFRIDQVVQFRVEEGDLVARTTLATTEARGRVTIPDMPGLTTVHVLRRPQDWPEQAPHPFQFIHRDMPRGELLMTLTSVFSGPGFMNVSRDVQTPQQIKSVQLIQTFRTGDPFTAPTEDPVRLYVQAFENETGQRLIDLMLTAESFETLRQKHPQEVAEYLEPIFRDLGADAVLAVDPRAAWQVFADRFMPGAELSSQIETVVAQLDAETFQQREAASEALERMGQPAALVLMQMDRARLSPEQNSRIDAFLTPYRPLSPEDKQRLRDNTDFLLNMLLMEDRQLRQAAFDRLRALHGEAFEFEIDAAAEERATQVQRAREQLSARD
jgi:hypothetical protein